MNERVNDACGDIYSCEKQVGLVLVLLHIHAGVQIDRSSSRPLMRPCFRVDLEGRRPAGISMYHKL